MKSWCQHTTENVNTEILLYNVSKTNWLVENDLLVE